MWPVLLASAVVLALLVPLLPDEDDRQAPGAADPVAAFLAAYERSRTATYVVEQTFTRTAPDGRSLTYERRLVQRPPDDRLLVGGGSAEGRLDGRVVRCTTSPDGTSGCTQGPPARPYDEDVVGEVAELRQLVEGGDPLYEVADGDDEGCWTLTLVEAYPSPPYGEEAGFCFDVDTGAPVRLEVRRQEAVDLAVTVEVRRTVTDADLQPGDLGDLPR